MFDRFKEILFGCLAIVVVAPALAAMQTTGKEAEGKPYPSGQGYFLFTNMNEVKYCNELPRSITRGTNDIENVSCLKADYRTARREDEGEAPSLFDLKIFYGLGFWLSVLPALAALFCFTDKPGVAKLGSMGKNFITLLSNARGLQKTILTAAVLAVMVSPLLFALLWARTLHGTLTVMVENAQRIGAHVEIGGADIFYLPPMSHAFVYIHHPRRQTPIHVSSPGGFEERAVLNWNDETEPWIYDIGGANGSSISGVTYLRR